MDAAGASGSGSPEAQPAPGPVAGEGAPRTSVPAPEPQDAPAPEVAAEPGLAEVSAPEQPEAAVACEAATPEAEAQGGDEAERRGRSRSPLEAPPGSDAEAPEASVPAPSAEAAAVREAAGPEAPLPDAPEASRASGPAPTAETATVRGAATPEAPLPEAQDGDKAERRGRSRSRSPRRDVEAEALRASGASAGAEAATVREAAAPEAPLPDAHGDDEAQRRGRSRSRSRPRSDAEAPKASRASGPSPGAEAATVPEAATPLPDGGDEAERRGRSLGRSRSREAPPRSDAEAPQASSASPGADAAASSVSAAAAPAPATAPPRSRPSAPPRGASRKWAPGDAVVVIALQSRPELNGKSATVVDILPKATGSVKYLLRVEGVDVHLAVRPENLLRDDGAAAVPREPSMPAEKRARRTEGDAAASEPRDFAAGLNRLRVRADKEAHRKKGKGHGRGGGSDDEADILRQPVAFVPASEDASGPNKRVVVIDPRGRGADDSDSDDERINVVPGRIKPPKVTSFVATHRRPTLEAWVPSGPGGALEAHAKHDAPSGGACASACGSASVPAVPPAMPAPAAEAADDLPSSTQPHVALSIGRRKTLPASGGNLTLTVSQLARDQDSAKIKTVERRIAMEEQKKQILAKLTQQMKLCLSRLQSGELDEAGKERYQDMIVSLNAQMAKVSGMKT